MIYIFKDKILRCMQGFITASAYVNDEGFLPDVNVPHNLENYTHSDTVFRNSVNTALRKAGYVGPDLYPAETGMQSKDCMVLEATDELEEFVKGLGFKKYDLEAEYEDQ